MSSARSAGWSAGPGSTAGGSESESAGEAALAGWSSRSIRSGLRSPPESVSESVIPGNRPPLLRSSTRPAARAPPLDQALGIQFKNSPTDRRAADRPLQNTKPVKPPSKRAECRADIARISRLIQSLLIQMSIRLRSNQRQSLEIQSLLVSVS